MTQSKPSQDPTEPTEPTPIAADEWMGGMATFPNELMADPLAPSPDGLFWIDADGALLGSTVDHPDELLRVASESLQSTIDDPFVGPPRVPARVRVTSSELAAALRAGHPTLEIVCAPTPKLDECLAAMFQQMTDDWRAETSYLSSERSPEAVASFFEAAAALFRAEPWKRLSSTQRSFLVTAEPFTVRGAVVSVLGTADDSLAVLLFANINDFRAYLDEFDAFEQGEDADATPHIELSYVPDASLAAHQRSEIETHQWEVASPKGTPRPLVFEVTEDGEPTARGLNRAETTFVEAILRALTAYLGDERVLAAVSHHGELPARAHVAQTNDGPLEIVLSPLGDPDDAQLDLFDDETLEERVGPASQSPRRASTPGASGPGPRPPSQKADAKRSAPAARTKKNKRKAQRRARKKNR